MPTKFVTIKFESRLPSFMAITSTILGILNAFNICWNRGGSTFFLTMRIFWKLKSVKRMISSQTKLKIEKNVYERQFWRGKQQGVKEREKRET
jgi:hypothetical protein